MNSSLLIASAVALLAFAHGVVILGKASRENHGAIYKIAGWFVIIAAFLVMACSMMHGAVSFYRMRDSMEMRGNRMMDWFHGNGNNYYAPHHRDYDYDDDYDYRDGGRYRRDRDYDNYREPRDYNNNSNTNMSRDTTHLR